MVLALAPNIHNALFANGYALNFEGLRRLEPRRRYIAVRYAPEIHEKLKFAKGDAGWGTLLAMEKKLAPVGITQLYPAEADGTWDTWYVALAVPRRKAVYGYREPNTNSGMGIAQLMTSLRKSSFHGPDTSDALFYIRDSPGYFTRNPHCTAYWSTVIPWGFVADEIKPKPRYPKLGDFIGDGFAEGVMIPYPPPETKPKTVNEWDRPAGLTESGLTEGGVQIERQLPLEELARRCPWATSIKAVTRAWDLTDRPLMSFDQRLNQAVKTLQLQYMVEPAPRPAPYATPWPAYVTSVVGPSSAFYGNAAPPVPKAVIQKEPEPLSKNGGRFVMLEDPE